MATFLNISDLEHSTADLAGLGEVLEESLNEIYIFDKASYQLGMVNRGARKNLGYTMAELRTLTPLAFIAEYDQLSFGQLLEPLDSGKAQRLDFEAVHRRKDGSDYHVEVRLQPMTFSAAPAYVAIVLDVTDRKLAQEAMQLAKLVYENSSQAIMITDHLEKIIDVNPAFTAITGYARDEAISRDARFLNSGQHDHTFYESMRQDLQNNGKWQGEIWNKRKNGEIYAERQTINTLFNADNSTYRRVSLFSDITRSKKTDELIWRQANFDALTNLPNRRMFVDRLNHQISKSARSEDRMALLFLDLDNFKDINDTLGHRVGDQLLEQVALRLRSCVRESDTVAHLGGDEFGIVLSDIEQTTGIERSVQFLLQKFSTPFKLNQEIIYVSISIGVVIYPDNGTTSGDLIKKADQAMYYAKKNGRNRACYFTPVMQDDIKNRMQLAGDLREAIKAQQFLVYYQPIVEMATGAINKAEALLRWPHPTRGFVAPDEFIPVAEDTGLIIELGNWVFNEVARQNSCWRNERGLDMQVSINKSPAELMSEQKAPYAWAEALKKQGLSGNHIVLEITEGLLLNPAPHVTSQLNEFHNAGIDLSLDDFGTGYSSLAYLKKFDIEYLKIDKTFIGNLSPDSDDMALCEAMIVMAHKLGIKVVAEGVETQQQYDLLARAHCDYAQGYLISKPVPAQEFEQVLFQD